MSNTTNGKTTEYTLTPENGIAGTYVSSYVDENGLLKKIDIHDAEHFNFGYDVVDVLAKKCPDKTAMLHVSKDGKERRFTFKDMMLYSNKTANYLRYLGIKRGDRVLLILKRHYQFWFTIVALHKIGAIAVPCSFLLTKKDFEYRLKAAEINAVVVTADGEVSEELDKAAKNYTGLKAKILVGGTKEGWSSYNRDIRYFSSTYKKPEDYAGGNDSALMFFTSGTTSYPKMATHSFKYPLGHYVTAKYWHQVDSEGLHFTISDTGWGKALWGKIYGQWLAEAPIFTYDYDEFFAKEILAMMERYHMTDLALRYVHGAIDEDEFRDLMEIVFHFIKIRKRIEVSDEEYEAEAARLYIDKVDERIETLKTLTGYEEIRSYIELGTKYKDIDEIVKRYKLLYGKITKGRKFVKIKVVGHGDLCFSNILYNNSARLLKLIDPKGATDEEGMYMNPFYDIAKLSHSICGAYDYFNSEQYEISIGTDMKLSLKIDADNDRYIKIFKEYLDKNDLDYRLIRLYEASLFLSMLPLHIDRPKKVLGFILNAVRIMDEIEV